MSESNSKNKVEFRTDTLLYKTTNSILSWFTVSVLWLITSIPIFTVGASTCAAIAVFLDNSEAGLAKTFFFEFRGSFKKSTVYTLCAELAAFIVILDISFYKQYSGITSKFSWMDFIAVLLILINVSAFRFLCFETVCSAGKYTITEILKKAMNRLLVNLPVAGVLFLMDIAIISTLIAAPVAMILLLLYPGIHADVFVRLVAWFNRRVQ